VSTRHASAPTALNSLKVVAVEPIAVRIPLKRAVAHASARHLDREYVILRLRTDQGLEGITFAIGGHALAAAIAGLSEWLLAQPSIEATAINRALRPMLKVVGRQGASIAALSAIDNALWDIHAKSLGLPLFRLLGGDGSAMPASIGVGLYYDDETLKDLAREFSQYAAEGYTGVKMRVGRLDAKDDVERVRVVREALGSNVALMMNANMAWRSVQRAAAFLRSIEQFNIHWIAEPFDPEDRLSFARLAGLTSIALATGEQESSAYAFGQLAMAGVVRALQPDVTRIGGVTEWIRVAGMAAALSIPIVPHAYPDLHSHLAPVAPTMEWVEYIPNETITNFDHVLDEPLRPVDGMLAPPNRPGFGLSINWREVARFRI
jgi:D-arabinonate dehydratase